MVARICTVPLSERTWKDVPNTNKYATVAGSRPVVDVMAICVPKGSIREAKVAGWFEVADVERPFTYEDGSLTVQVKCYWYGLQPEKKKQWMKLRISNKYQFVRRFTGDVVNNVEEIE